MATTKVEEVLQRVRNRMKWSITTLEDGLRDCKTPYSYTMLYCYNTWDTPVSTAFSRWVNTVSVDEAVEGLVRYAKLVSTDEDVAGYFWLAKKMKECAPGDYGDNSRVSRYVLAFAHEMAKYPWKVVDEADVPDSPYYETPERTNFWLTDEWDSFRDICLYWGRHIGGNTIDTLIEEDGGVSHAVAEFAKKRSTVQTYYYDEQSPDVMWAHSDSSIIRLLYYCQASRMLRRGDIIAKLFLSGCKRTNSAVRDFICEYAADLLLKVAFGYVKIPCGCHVSEFDIVTHIDKKTKDWMAGIFSLEKLNCCII